MTEQGASGYRSSVVAPMQLLLGAASGIAVAIVLVVLNSDLWPVSIIALLVAVGVGWYLAPVTVDIDDKRITVGQGRGERDPRVVYVAEVRDAGLRELNWLQCVGFNIDDDDRTTRLAVRPGTTLQLLLHDGQRLLISISDGPAALGAIEAAAAST